MGTLQALWQVVGATGGALALAFIVLLAIGLVALTVLFGGAALVVLERFARLERRWPTTLAAWALASVAAAWVGLDVALPGAWTRRAELVTTLPAALAAGAVAVAVSMAIVRLLLAIARPRTLAVLAVVAGALGLLAVLPVPPVAWLGLAARQGLAAAGLALLFALGALVLLGLAPLGAAGLADTRGGVEWFVAVRYLVAKRRQTFISVITSICVAGVAAGVWLIITVLSVMNGFERTWRDEIIGNRAHFTVQSGLGPFGDWEQVLARVREVPGVAAASPFLQAEGMVRGDNGEIVGVRVQGIDPTRIGDVTDLRDDLIAGSLEDLAAAPEGEDGAPGIVIGDQLAGALGLSVGDPLLLVSPFGGPPTPLGPSPRLSRFRVAGVFRSTFFQYDEVVTYVSLAAAQDFRRLDGDVVDGLEVRTDDLYRSAQIGEQVEQALGFPFFSRDWKEFFPAFFQALKTERVMMFVLLTMIMVVAAFAIVVTLVMMIMEKAGDIAILKAMGARDAAIERIFAIEGALIGLVGTVIGVIAGIAVTTRLDWVQRQVEAITGIDALPASVYQGISQLPAELDPLQIAVVVGIAMALALGGTLIPSRQGARLDPVEALRYE
ncbi:MAG: lipoprotein-releasing ABC transporter permease subunit [Deltaproteobacteria bacterium]|nr:lipoprotein-releasing ABC transporter permease subunit [Deltaproteobacteria bacterium]